MVAALGWSGRASGSPWPCRLPAPGQPPGRRSADRLGGRGRRSPARRGRRPAGRGGRPADPSRVTASAGASCCSPRCAVAVWPRWSLPAGAWAWQGADGPLRHTPATASRPSPRTRRRPQRIRTLVLAADLGRLTTGWTAASRPRWRATSGPRPSRGGRTPPRNVVAVSWPTPAPRGRRGRRRRAAPPRRAGFVLVRDPVPAALSDRLDDVAGLAASRLVRRRPAPGASVTAARATPRAPACSSPPVRWWTRSRFPARTPRSTPACPRARPGPGPGAGRADLVAAPGDPGRRAPAAGAAHRLEISLVVQGVRAAPRRRAPRGEHRRPRRAHLALGPAGAAGPRAAARPAGPAADVGAAMQRLRVADLVVRGAVPVLAAVLVAFVLVEPQVVGVAPGRATRVAVRPVAVEAAELVRPGPETIGVRGADASAPGAVPAPVTASAAAPPADLRPPGPRGLTAGSGTLAVRSGGGAALATAGTGDDASALVRAATVAAVSPVVVGAAAAAPGAVAEQVCGGAAATCAACRPRPASRPRTTSGWWAAAPRPAAAAGWCSQPARRHGRGERRRPDRRRVCGPDDGQHRRARAALAHGAAARRAGARCEGAGGPRPQHRRFGRRRAGRRLAGGHDPAGHRRRRGRGAASTRVLVPGVRVGGAATLRIAVPGSTEAVAQVRLIGEKGPVDLPDGGVSACRRAQSATSTCRPCPAGPTRWRSPPTCRSSPARSCNAGPPRPVRATSPGRRPPGPSPRWPASPRSTRRPGSPPPVGAPTWS